MAGAARRRADLALDEAEDVQAAARGLVTCMERALADGAIDRAEAEDARRRARRVLREAEETVVAVEWTGVGELCAVAKLTGRGSINAELRELEVQRRAAELGIVLASAR